MRARTRVCAQPAWLRPIAPATERASARERTASVATVATLRTVARLGGIGDIGLAPPPQGAARPPHDHYGCDDEEHGDDEQPDLRKRVFHGVRNEREPNRSGHSREDQEHEEHDLAGHARNLLLRGERHSPYAAERLPESREHHEAGVNRDAIQPARAERRQRVLVLQPPELALDSRVATVEPL